MLISNSTDRAALTLHLTRLRILSAALAAREGAGRLPDKAQIIEALYSIRAMRNILSIEMTSRRVNGRA